MDENDTAHGQVFRVGVHILVLIGILAAFFLALGVVILVKRNDYTFLAVAAAGTVLLFLLLKILRLEIGPAGFKYRNLSGSREVDFADVARAFIDVKRASKAPQGVAGFWIERRDGSRLKVNIRTFPLPAAAMLFSALEAHGIQIEVPDLWAARRMAEQVRAAQKKLHSQSPAKDPP